MKLQLLIVMILVSMSAHGSVYKWVDENGKVHYSDKKPDRDEVELVRGNTSESSGTEVLIKSLLGHWRGKNGGLSTNIDIVENGKFSGIVKERGRLVWAFNGLWKLRGKKFTWDYKESMPPLPDAMKNKPDINTIVSLDKNTLILKESNGKLTEYTRVQ